MEESYLFDAIKLLHSSAPDSAKKIRALLNVEILKNFDKTKLIENTLSKEEIDLLMSQESKARGSELRRKHKTNKPRKDVISISSKKKEVIKIKEEDDKVLNLSSENSCDMDFLLNDLSCVLCRQVEISANNQLFECTKCQQLWHQQCHTAKIPDETYQRTWICSVCSKDKKKEESPKSSHHKKEKLDKEHKSSHRKKESKVYTSSKTHKKHKEPSSSKSRSNKKSP